MTTIPPLPSSYLGTLASRKSTDSSQSQSQSHIATNGQSISKSWCRAPSEAHDQIFITVWQLRPCFCGAPSLTRAWVCLLYMLLALVSVVFLGSESLGTRLRFVTSLFVASYDSQDHGGGIRTNFVLFITSWHGLHREYRSSIVAWIRFRGNVLTQSLYSNDCTRHISYRDNFSIVACGYYLATAVFLAPQFFLWANASQYNWTHLDNTSGSCSVG
jgi:hypothetical protein